MRAYAAVLLLVSAGPRGDDRGHEHGRHGRRRPDLGAVLGQLAPRHPPRDLPYDPAEHRVARVAHRLLSSRCRSPYAIRDCRLQSSINPGDAAWEKRPPDSPKLAS